MPDACIYPSIYSELAKHYPPSVHAKEKNQNVQPKISSSWMKKGIIVQFFFLTFNKQKQKQTDGSDRKNRLLPFAQPPPKKKVQYVFTFP